MSRLPHLTETGSKDPLQQFRRTKVYLAGPMRGIPQFNFPAFFEAAGNLRGSRFEVWSPAEHDVHADGFDPVKENASGAAGTEPHTFRHYMQRDLPAVIESDAVCVLPGWGRSTGARLEVYVARQCKIPIVDAHTLHIFTDAELDAYLAPPGKLANASATTRSTTLPDDAKERKTYPLGSGCVDYFPDALLAVAHVSYVGNEQHHPGQPLHWDRSKSTDEADTILRHFTQRGTLDKDGLRHTAKMAWRALALLQKELETR